MHIAQWLHSDPLPVSSASSAFPDGSYCHNNKSNKHCNCKHTKTTSFKVFFLVFSIKSSSWSLPVASLLAMESHSWNSDIEGLCDGVFKTSNFEAKTRNGSTSNSSLVLDSRRGELVEANVNVGKKGVSTERNTEALRNHCEAERKRRARINAHLDTLRTIVPGAKKMDKASLLAAVISHMKELKRNAAEASEGFFVPTDVDELRVEGQGSGVDGSPYIIRVSLCCDYKPGLLSDLKQAFDALHLIVMKAEIATLEGRMKNVFVISSYKEQSEDTEIHQPIANSVNQAIRSILDKFSATHEFSSKSTVSNKRRRISLFDPSSSSGDLW